MAKKGGVQQLQADLTTDEEFERFLERPGLLVLDVYSEWCGPCLGMVGSLKKIKLELGGDNLHLAICKSDTISYLSRFQKKSEPSWLFVRNGRATNLMFGTNVPKLMKLIEQELRSPQKATNTFDITELQPEEVARKKKKEDAIAEAERVELAEKDKKRQDYLNYVTDTIMDNMPDIGVTLFGPQVNRDMFKKIMEPADVLKIQCKDRKVVAVTKENFDVVNYACDNQIDPEVLKQLDQKELLLCFWKMADDNRRPVEEILGIYASELTKTRTEPPDEYNEEERVIPPIVAPLDIKMEVELQEGEEYVEEVEAVDDRKSKFSKPEGEGAEEEELQDEGEDVDEDEEAENAEEEQPAMPELGMALSMDVIDDEAEEKSIEIVVEEPPVKRTRIKTVRVPPIWVPGNHRTHAAMIYVFFRQQTAPFLPPDPIPDPPHVIMAFDAYKKRDLIGIAERHKDDIPFYGFFTSDDADDTTYLANSAHKYATAPHTAGDKIVFKVNKQTSNIMLSLATYGPSYVSPNTVVGHEEALKFFPKTYKTHEQEEAEMKEEEDKEPKKRRKSKKSSIVEAIVVEAPPEIIDDDMDIPPMDEGGPTISGDDSGEGEGEGGEGAVGEGETGSMDAYGQQAESPPAADGAADGGSPAPAAAPPEAPAEAPAAAAPEEPPDAGADAGAGGGAADAPPPEE